MANPHNIRRGVAAILSLAAILLHTAGAVTVAADGVCEVVTDKTVQPTNILVGQEVEVTLALDSRCPPLPGAGEADIMLVLDRSNSQRENGTWQPTIQAATTFVDLIDFDRHQVGVATFSGGLPLIDPDTVLRQALTSDGSAVRAALAAIPQPSWLTGPTNLTAAVEAGQAELTSPRHRPSAQPVLVLLSDGGHNKPGTRSPEEAAADAKDDGTTIVTIGLAVDSSAAQSLTAMASRPELYFAAPTAADLENVLREVAGQVTEGRVTGLIVTDLLPPEVEYVPGSASPPPASFNADTLVWNVPSLQSAGWTARYRVRALVAGTYSTNKLAYVDYTDADGTPGSGTFPLPTITVREPEPVIIHLPLVMKNSCQPGKPFDVVLALDTSSSMWGEKLIQTREAAREFLRFLPMPPSQAGVVAFNGEAQVVTGLTPRRTDALAALDRLPRAEGSRIDLALTAAAAELNGPRRVADHAPVLILLTDGRQAGAPRDAALSAAAGARGQGVTIYTIGVGSDVDPQLLINVAGSRARYYFAPTPAELAQIYRDIAGALPCQIQR